MQKEKFIKKIEIEAEKLNIVFNDKQKENFYNYMQLLLKWNNNINLTTITDPEDIITKHFIDSLTSIKYIEKDSKIVDIGTGAGFPGIPIAITNKMNNITLVDALNKRVTFLNEVVDSLELNNVTTMHSRAEDFGKNRKFREKYDITISRAVARLNVLVEYLLPLVKIGGKSICMKGPNVEEEIEDAKNAIRELGGEIEKIEEFYLPDLDIKRTIIIIKKIKTTPTKYPRKAGVPTKNPIK